MTAPIQTSFYISSKDNPQFEKHMKTLQKANLLKPTQEKTVFVFGSNPALGVFEKCYNTDVNGKIINGKVVRREKDNLKTPEPAPLPQVKTIASFVVSPQPAPAPSLQVEPAIPTPLPPRPSTPPPKEPANEITSPERIKAAQVLTDISNTLRRQMPKKPVTLPPIPGQPVQGAKMEAYIRARAQQRRREEQDAKLMPPPASKQPRTQKASSVQSFQKV